MGFISKIWSGISGSWQTIMICISAVIIIFAIEQYRIKSVTTERDQLKGAHEQDIQAVGKANATVTQVLADAKRQVKLIAKERDDAQKRSDKANARYLQIMQAPASDDGPLSPGLCAGLDRLRQRGTAYSDTQLQVLHPKSNAGSTSVAGASHKCTFTQKDLDAWLETQVKPAFDTCTSRLEDLSTYVNSQ